MVLFNFSNKRRSKKSLIGVGFTSENITVAQVSYELAQQPRLLLCESSTIDLDQTQASDKLSTVLKIIIKKIKSSKFIVNVAIQQHDRQLLLIEAPQVESSELNDAVRWKVKDMIDYNIDDAVIDVIAIPNITELKRSPMVYVVLVKREKIQSIVELCNQCGTALSVIDIPDMAQRNFAALLSEDKNGVAILSINSNNSLLTITRNGELYLSRELETGFEQLMSGVQDSSSLSNNNNSSPDNNPELNSIAMLQSLEKMVLEVQRSLDYYESQYNQPQISALYLAPFAYDVPEIKDYFATQLGLKTKMLDFNLLFATDEPISHQLQAKTFYAVGAALR